MVESNDIICLIEGHERSLLCLRDCVGVVFAPGMPFVLDILTYEMHVYLGFRFLKDSIIHILSYCNVWATVHYSKMN